MNLKGEVLERTIAQVEVLHGLGGGIVEKGWGVSFLPVFSANFSPDGLRNWGPQGPEYIKYSFERVQQKVPGSQNPNFNPISAGALVGVWGSISIYIKPPVSDEKPIGGWRILKVYPESNINLE